VCEGENNCHERTGARGGRTLRGDHLLNPTGTVRLGHTPESMPFPIDDAPTGPVPAWYVLPRAARAQARNRRGAHCVVTAIGPPGLPCGELPSIKGLHCGLSCGFNGFSTEIP